MKNSVKLTYRTADDVNKTTRIFNSAWESATHLQQVFGDFNPTLLNSETILKVASYKGKFLGWYSLEPIEEYFVYYISEYSSTKQLLRIEDGETAYTQRESLASTFSKSEAEVLVKILNETTSESATYYYY